MTARRNNQPLETAPASWADVISASESLVDASADIAIEDASSESPEVVTLLPGDTIMHAKFGRCTVHHVAEGVIHMAKETGRVIRVRQDMLPIRALGVETLGNKNTRRIFTTSTEHSCNGT